MMADKAEQVRANLTLIACIAICTLGPLSGIAQSALPPVLPRIGEHFADVPNANVLVRLMMTGLSAAMIIGALASGFLAERFGQLRLLYLCLALFALSGLASYFVDNLYFLVGMRVVLGAVNSAAGVLGTALIVTRLSGTARDRWLGFYITIGTVASLVWVSFAGVIGAIDWRLVFLLQLFALPAALFIGATLKEDRSLAAESGRSVAKTIPWGMTLFGLVCGAIGTSVFIFLPFHLKAIGYGDPASIGPLLTVSMGAGVVMALSFGVIRKYCGAIPVFVGGFVLTGTGLLAALATENYVLLGVGLAIYGAGFGVITPNLFSACAAATRMELRTRVLGFMRAGYYAGPLAVQPFLEVTARRGGPDAALMTLAVAALAASGLFIVSRGRFTPVDDDHAVAGAKLADEQG